MSEPDLDRLPHVCREGVWPVPCDERCPVDNGLHASTTVQDMTDSGHHGEMFGHRERRAA